VLFASPVGELGGDASRLGGTIGAPAPTTDGPVLDRELVQTGWVQGEAILRAVGLGVRLELNLEFVRDVRLELGFDPQTWSMTALEPDPGFEGRSIIQPGRVQFESVTPGQYAVVLRPRTQALPTSVVRVELVGQEGRLERELVVRPSGGGEVSPSP